MRFEFLLIKYHTTESIMRDIVEDLK